MYRHKITITKNNNPIRKKQWLVRWKSEYDVTADSRKYHCKSFVRKVDAQRYANQLQDDFDAGIDIQHRDISLKNLCQKFLDIKAGELQYTSWVRYEQTVNQILTYFNPEAPVRQFKQEDCELFISKLDYIHPIYKQKSQKISDSARHQYLRHLRTIFNKAVEWNYVTKNPFEKITLGKVRTQQWYYITPEDYHNLLTVLDKLRIRKKCQEEDRARIIRLKAFYAIMYGTGLRFGEAVNCQFGDNINLQTQQIHIHNRPGTDTMPFFNVKDYESRVLPIPQSTLSYLTELQKITDCPYPFLSENVWQRAQAKWIELRQNGQEHIWTSKHMMTNALRDFKRYCQMAGIQTSQKLNIHCLRKAYGTNLANLQTPAHTLKELMGHSSILTTMKYYLQTSDANKVKAIDSLNRLLA